MNERSLKVLEQYDLEIISTRRGRGSYICETDQGWKQLWSFTGSEKKLAFQNRILKELKESGYEQVDLAQENKEGGLVVKDWEENRYVLKDCFPGRECSPSSERDILEAVENLARLHLLLRFPGEEREYCGQMLSEELEAKNRELKKVRAFVRKREPKHPFEQLFLQSFQEFFDQARSAQEQAKENLSRQDLEAQIQSGTLCHGDYHYHHVLFLNPGVATVHFEKCRFDFPVQDLYQFMRKILEKHGWELSLGERMLSAYDGIRRLSETELKILRLRMAYPEKFWKLANHYYGSSKAWIPVRYQQKLELLNRQQKQKNNFLKILE